MMFTLIANTPTETINTFPFWFVGAATIIAIGVILYGSRYGDVNTSD